MKKCKFTFLATLLCTSLISANVFAADLVDVYEKARVNDPKIKAARYNWFATRENIAISRSSLLPQLSASGSLSRKRSEQEGAVNIFTNPTGKRTLNYHNELDYGLQLTQSIFSFSNWANIWKAKAETKSAKASFLAEEQNLLLRTAEAYFNVLKTKSILNYAGANKEATKRLYVQSKHKYDVGITPITDLEEARTKYELARAEEIKAANELDNSFEKLTAITKVRYKWLAPLKNSLPLLSPNPANIENWSKTAEQQNFSLLAARFNTLAARENIKVQNAGHIPTIEAQLTYGYNFQDRAKVRTKSAAGTAGISIPLFQGGKVYYSAKQANHLYQKASAEQEEQHRAVISQTRQSYLGVISSISKIKADRQAIRSAKSSVRANRASYSVGTRTMSDVLTAQTQLFDTQRTYAEDEYNYIIQFLQLKAQSGILRFEDLQQINSWLKTPKQKKEIIKVDKVKKVPGKKRPPLKK